MATWKQLTAKRTMAGVTRKQMQRELDCSMSWLRLLEGGLYQSPASLSWKEKYEIVLDRLIAEKKKEEELCR